MSWPKAHRCPYRVPVIEEEPKTGPADVSRTLTDAMERAGVHPAYVHAVRICGFVCTDANRASLTSAQLQQWDDALDDWFDRNPGNE